MKIHGGVTGTTVLTVLGIALTACGGSSSKVAVDKLQQAADKAIAAPANPCPLGFDVNAALKKAKVAGTATPAVIGTSSGTPAVDAESATTAGSDTPLQRFGGAMITCAYTLSGGASMQVTVTGVRTSKAIDLLAPQLQRDGTMDRSDLETVVTQKLTTGKAVLTPGPGLAAITKLDASGGDVLLEVTTRAADQEVGPGQVLGEPLRELAEALGKQVRV